MHGVRKKLAEEAYVEDGIVVYGNHTTLDLFRNLNGISLIRPKDAGTKTVFCAIGEFDGFLHGFITLDQSNRGEHCKKKNVCEHKNSFKTQTENSSKRTFVLGDKGIIRWVTNNRGVEIRSRAKVGMNVRLSSRINRSAIGFSLIEHSLDITETVPGNHGTNIRIGFESFDRRGKNGP